MVLSSSAQQNDFFIAPNSDGVFDMVIEKGQFKTVYSFDTALQRIIYGERRAAPSEVPLPVHRRGWFGNLILSDTGFEQGSKLWLLFQSRIDDSTVTRAVDYLRTACQWLVDNQHAKAVDVHGELILNQGVRKGVRVYIDITTHNNEVDSRFFELWQNTGKRTIIVNTTELGYLLQEDVQIPNPAWNPVTGETTILNPLYDPNNPTLYPQTLPNPSYDPNAPKRFLTITGGQLLLDGFDINDTGAILINFARHQ